MSKHLSWLAGGVFRRLRRVWDEAAAMYRREHFVVSCRLQGVELVLGKGVCFCHAVRVWAVAGSRVILDDGVQFGTSAGDRWRGPVIIQLRASGAEVCLRRGCVIMPDTEIICFTRIELGVETQVGIRCALLDSNVHDVSPDRWDEPGQSRPIQIGTRVRIAPDSTILKGVSIGDFALVGNKSVVQRSLPSRCFAQGNPVRVFERGIEILAAVNAWKSGSEQ